MNLKPYLTQKLLKMDYRSKYKAKTIKILKEKKWEKILVNLEQAQNCWIEHKSLIIKEKKLINQTKFKTSYFQKTPLRK